MTTTDKLLPCPFCGGTPTLVLGNGAYGVNCTCKGEAFIQTYGGGFRTSGITRDQAKENAIAAWNRRASQAAPAPSDGLRETLDYVLQDDLHNRLTPRVVDIAYSAFMLGRTGKNSEDGGPYDWFNDTKPMVDKQIGKIRAALPTPTEHR